MSIDRIDLTQLISDVFAEFITRVMTQDLLEEQAGDGITPPLFQVMQYIYRHPGCSVRQIANAITVTVPAASQFIERLVKKELANRTEDSKDRRISQIRLTPRGSELIERLLTARNTRISSILSQMNPDRREALTEGLQEFISWALQDTKSAHTLCLHCGTDHTPCCVVNMAHLSTTGKSIGET